MNSHNPRLERLKELLSLEERRVALQQDLESLTKRMSSLRDSLFDEGAHVLAAAEASSPAPATGARRGRPPGRPNKSSKRGALKEQIAGALESAGAAGVKVKELAVALGAKAVNIHSWFHSALKRFPQIKKIKGGHYRLEGKLDLAAGARRVGRPPKSASTESSPRAAASVPVGRGSKKASGKSSSKTRRGALSEKIMSELEKAGSKGFSVRDLAEKIGVNYRNIYIWFATTGKKNAKIKKVAPAVFRYEG